MQNRLSAFRNADFRKLMAARVLFTLSVQMQAVLIGWQIYDLTQDPLSLGLIGLTEAVPALSLALFAGVLVDRGNPRKIYRRVILTSFVSAFLLLVTTAQWIHASFETSIQLRFLYLGAFLTGLARGFSSPSLYAMIPRLLPREAVTVSSAWITFTIHLATLSGPALGGLLFGYRGALLAYGVICLCLLTSAVLVTWIRTPTPPLATTPVREPIFHSIREGVRFVFADRILLSSLSLDLFAVFFGGVTALLPVFARDILSIGPEGLGWLRAAPAGGALLMTFLLIRRPIAENAGKVLLWVVGGFGLTIIGFGISTNPWLSGFLLALGGALDAVSMVIRSAIVQLRSPAEMRGRIASVNSMFIGSSNELGAFESGVAARLLGTVPSVIFGGTMTLLTVLLIVWKAPSLRKLHFEKTA
jgi:MFS family permease